MKRLSLILLATTAICRPQPSEATFRIFGWAGQSASQVGQCPYGSALPDGCAQQNPKALTIHRNFLTGYTGRVYPNTPHNAATPWNVAGVDYPVGADATATWDPTTGCTTTTCNVTSTTAPATSVLTVPDGAAIGTSTATGYFQVGMPIYFTYSAGNTALSPYFAGHVTGYSHAGTTSTYTLDQAVTPPTAGTYYINVIGSGCHYTAGTQVSCSASASPPSLDIENFNFNPPSLSGSCIPLIAYSNGNIIVKNNTIDANSTACASASGSAPLKIYTASGHVGNITFQNNTLNGESNSIAINNYSGGPKNQVSYGMTIIARGDGISTGLLTIEENAFLNNPSRIFQNNTAGTHTIKWNYFESMNGVTAHGEWYFDQAITTVDTNLISTDGSGNISGFSVTFTAGQPVYISPVPTGATLTPAPISGYTYYICAPSSGKYKLATTYANAIAGTCDVTIGGAASTANGTATYTPVPTQHSLYDGYNTYYSSPNDLWPSVTGILTPSIGLNMGAAAWNNLTVTHDVEVARLTQTSNYLTVTTQPVAGNTLTVGATTYTFVASGATGPQINIGATTTATAQNIQAVLAAQDTNYQWYTGDTVNPTRDYYQGTLANAAVSQTGGHLTINTGLQSSGYSEVWPLPYVATFQDDTNYRDAFGEFGCINQYTYFTYINGGYGSGATANQNMQQTAPDPNINTSTCAKGS